MRRAAIAALALSGAAMLANGEAAWTSGAAIAGHKAIPSAELRRVNLYGKIPLSFELNEGQTDEHVKFVSHGPGYTLFLTQSGAVLALRKRRNERETGTLTGKRDAKPESIETQVLRLKLVGSNPHAKVGGLARLLGKANYFIGNDPKKWRTNIPTYLRVRYHDVYPGIDVVYYGTDQDQLEYDFIVSSGTDPKAITLRFEGAKKLALNGKSDVVATLPDGGQLVQHLPAIYQERDRKREKVRGRVVLRGKDAIGFDLAEYDRHRAIYIDPGLVYSTFLGGSRNDHGVGIAVDSAGDAYVTGGAFSADFPTTSGAFQTAIPNPNFTAFVAKLNPSASGEASLVYSTYLGGSDADQGGGIAVDSFGDAYVTGTTNSTDFPTTPGAFQTVNNSAGTLVGSNAFVTVLNPTGSSLLYSTYLGGYQGGEVFYALGLLSGIAVDTSGDAYVTGSTLAISNSSCGGAGAPFDCCTGLGTGTCIPFPTTAGAYQTVNNAPGGLNVFIAKLDPSASGAASLLYSSYLGGIGGAGAGGIAVDSAGNVYLTGVAGADFPITSGAFQTVSNGAAGAPNSFVAKINPSAAGATSLVYSTYLGGGGINYPGVETIGDRGTSIAVDSAGDAYVTGTTVSVSNANCGGKGVTSFGLYEACCIGRGTGTCIPFPTTAGAFQAVSNGYTEPFSFGSAFVTKLNAAGSALVYSTYLGGSGGEYGSGIAIDSAGDAYVTGDTVSTSNAQCTEINPASCCTGVGIGTCIPFPTTPGAFQTVNNDGTDAFVAKLNPSALGGASLVYSTYLGGNSGPSGLGGDYSNSIAVGSAGDAYVTGSDFSGDFPNHPGRLPDSQQRCHPSESRCQRLHHRT